MNDDKYKKIEKRIEKHLDYKGLLDPLLDGLFGLIISMLLLHFCLPLGLIFIIFVPFRLVSKYETTDETINDNTNDIEENLKNIKDITLHHFKVVNIKDQYYSSKQNLFKKMCTMLEEYHNDKISKFKLKEKIIKELKNE